MSDAEKGYLLVDGENIDMTLGAEILKARPRPEQRPRWERVADFAANHFERPMRSLFFLNASRGLPMTFVAALHAMGFVPVPLSGNAEQKVVDVAINRTLDALAGRGHDVMLASHDRDFADGLRALVEAGSRVAVLGFEEFVSGELRDVEGLEILDIEHDAEAFDGAPLPRVRVIPIDDFDPLKFL